MRDTHTHTSTAVMVNLSHEMPPPSWTISVLLHILLLAHVSSIAGVTHWKLEDDSITPGKAEDVLAVNLADSDPEFAILVRHTTKMSGVSGGGNRKPRPIITATVDGQKGGGGTRSHCPVLTVDLSSDGM